MLFFSLCGHELPIPHHVWSAWSVFFVDWPLWHLKISGTGYHGCSWNRIDNVLNLFYELYCPNSVNACSTSRPAKHLRWGLPTPSETARRLPQNAQYQPNYALRVSQQWEFVVSSHVLADSSPSKLCENALIHYQARNHMSSNTLCTLQVYLYGRVGEWL